MVEIADIFRLHGPEYLSQFRDRMPPSHLRAMEDIEHCRTEALGGQLYFCDQCNERHYSYHSCKNRHCPKCQNDQANEWLDNQKSLLLPVSYFMVTFTLPEELRSPARSNQKFIYNLLFQASSEALLELACDPRFRQPERLVAVAIAAPGSNAPISSFSYPVFREVREKNSVFAGMFAYAAMPMSISDGGQAENDH